MSELRLAPVERIRCPGDSFEVVISVNNLQFWDYGRALEELKR